MIYREGEDYSRQVEEWLGDYRHFGGEEIEVLSPDSLEGESFLSSRRLIVGYPYLAVVDDSGRVVFENAGLPLPKFDEVKYYQLQK